MKRSTSPIFWPIRRKGGKFTIRPSPGPHPKKECIPIGIILRDILGVAQTLREVKKILGKGLVKVDGVVRKDYAFPVGLMDVFELGNDAYRILPNKKGLAIQKIPKKESKIKLSKIKNKTTLKGGKIQLNLNDGKNIRLDENRYKTGDVLVLDIEKKKIVDVLPFEKGSIGIITKGKNIGAVGTIEEVTVSRSPNPNPITFKIGAKKIAVPGDYVFVVGKDKPVITIGGSNE
jgi:small subunit ribosomal protein S4e